MLRSERAIAHRKDRHLRTFTKGCFIELDEVRDDGQWTTHFRWNYAMQQDLDKNTLTFPAADIGRLIAISSGLTQESVLLDVEAKDFPAVCRRACGKADSGLNWMGESADCIMATKHVGRTELDDEGIHFVPGEEESAFSINVLSSKRIMTKSFVFCRLASPVPCLTAQSMPAKFCLFCLGPEAMRDECVAEGCTFAAIMCDRIFRTTAEHVADAAALREHFCSYIQDLVVLPHFHIHSSLHSVLDSKHAEGEEVEDLGAAVTEMLMADMNGIKETSSPNRGSDSLERLHERTHRLDKSFQESRHHECFVQMVSLQDGHKVVLCRWHNALEQKCRTHGTHTGEIWTTPHLPHVQAPYLLEAVQNLTAEDIRLDVPAASVADMYRSAGAALLGAIQEFGVEDFDATNALDFLLSGGVPPAQPHAVVRILC